MLKLKGYQSKLSEEVEYCLLGGLDRNTTNQVLVIKGATGTGKTPTLSNILNKTNAKYKGLVTFIYVTPGQGDLHEQAFLKFQGFIGNKIDLSLANEQFFRTNQNLPAGHILFVGWQQIWATGKDGKMTSRLLRDNEFNSNLSKVVERTRARGIKVVLIIDESQLIANSENSRLIRSGIIQPDFTIEASATPLYWESANHKFEMAYQDAVDEGVVKKFAYINRFTRKSKIDTEYLLDESLKTNRWLRKKLDKLGVKVNPLLGIQIPNGKQGDIVKDKIIKLLSEAGITFENGKLAIWTDSQKINLEGIKENTSQVEVLIFKQAVAVGWDCPRAYVWLNLRPSSKTNQIFSIQTCGRFLRMAELCHYEDEDLNCAYIFTDDASYKIAPEDMKYLSDSELATKAFDTSDTKFKTKYESREGFYNDYEADLADPVLSRRFKTHFGLTNDVEKNKEILKSLGINFKPSIEQRKILKNKKVASEELTMKNVIHSDDEVAKFITEPEILNQKIKDSLAQELIQAGMAPGRSGDRPRNSMFRMFQRYVNPKITFGEFNKILAHQGNYKKLVVPFQETLNYLKKVRKNKKKQIKTNEWTPVDQQWYPVPTYSKKSGTSFYDKHLFQPYYSAKSETTEDQFHLWITEQGLTSRIQWWLHNGVTKKRDLGLTYSFNKEIRLTYPDRLFKTNKGNYWLFEIKHETDQDGFTLTKAKAEAIQKWIKIQRKAGINIVGGIVIQFNGRWMINCKPNYNWAKTLKGDLSDWEPLEKFLKKAG